MRGISSRYTARLAASLVAIVLAGCGGGGGSGDPPNIGLTVTPPSIALGASSTLSWTSSGAATCQASGAWSGARPVIGSETVSPTAPGSYTYTLNCSNVVGGSSVSGTLTVTPPVEQSLTIEGQVVDRPIANAAVTVRVGSRNFTGTAGADGRYSIVATVPSDAVADFVSIDALGSAADPTVRFRSLLGTFSALQAQAGADRRLVASENFNVNVTNVSTAEAVLVSEANGGALPGDAAALERGRLAVDQDRLTEYATIIRLVVNGEFALPTGVVDTLDLIDDEATRFGFLVFLRTDEVRDPRYVAARATVDADPALTPGVTTAAVPRTLYLPIRSTRALQFRYAVVNGPIDGFELNADGGGMFLSTSGAFPGLRWAVDGNRTLQLSFVPPLIGDPREQPFIDPATGTEVLVACRIELRGIAVRRGLGVGAVRTFTFFRTCDDPRFNETTFDRGGRYWLPLDATERYLTSNVAGRTFSLVVDASDVPSLETSTSGGLAQEIASFSANGTGSLNPTGRSFTWIIEADGALRVTLGNGTVSRYRRYARPFDGAELAVADHRYTDGRRRISDQLGYASDGSLVFSNATIRGVYYTFGIGSDGSENGGGSILGFPQLRGSVFQFLAGDEFRNSNDALSSSAPDSPRMIIRGSLQRWAVRGDGSVSVQLYRRASSNDNTGCTLDSTDPDCNLVIERRLLPIAVNAAGRHFWLEQLRLIDGFTPVTASTPWQTTVRFYDFAPTGDYEAPAHGPSVPEADAVAHPEPVEPRESALGHVLTERPATPPSRSAR